MLNITKGLLSLSVFFTRFPPNYWFFTKIVATTDLLSNYLTGISILSVTFDT